MDLIEPYFHPAVKSNACHSLRSPAILKVKCHADEIS